ncbi:hypothetical protein ABFS83_01G006400 [Erythranthe nasuta]
MPSRFMNKGGFGFDEIQSGEEQQRFFVGKKVVEEIKDSCSSEESSSIGKNSDLSDNNSLDKSEDCDEVQSSYKGPLDAMDSLEEVLPIRRGISRFYNGKSKSFTCLADQSSSIKDITKPDNAYVRKRRNLLACNIVYDKTRSSTSSSTLRGINGGGISKRVTGSGRTAFALAVAMKNSENDDNKQFEVGSSLPSSLSSSPRKDLSAWRSFSLADLQQCVSIAITCSNSNELATTPS